MCVHLQVYVTWSQMIQETESSKITRKIVADPVLGSNLFQYGHIWPYWNRLDPSTGSATIFRVIFDDSVSWIICDHVTYTCRCTHIHQGCAADQSGKFFVRRFWSIFRSRWPLFGPPWPSPGPPGLRFNSLDLQESGLDPAETNFRLKIFSRVLKNQKSHF